jgi:hypothetical protein
MSKYEKELEAKQQIEAFIDLTLKELGVKKEDVLKHFDRCFTCQAPLVTCPFCKQTTVLDYQCHSCLKVLPLKSLTQALAERIVKKI